jgi:GNAT superfamily N-acetyltransferase
MTEGSPLWDVDHLSYEADSSLVTALAELLNEYVSFGLADDSYMRKLFSTGDVYVIRELHGEIIGTVTSQKQENSAVIKHLVVREGSRGMGIASYLLQHAMKELPVGIQVHAEGWAKPHGWEAEKIFLREGFSIESVDVDYWKDNCNSTDYCPYFTGTCNCACKLVMKHT